MRYIKYIGPAHVRQITAADWRSVGLTGDHTMWAGFNGWSVPADSLTEDQIRKAIDPDPQFVIVGYEEGEEPKPVLTPSATPESAAAGEFNITDDADRERAQETVTEAGQVDDKTPASTTGGALSAKASR